MKDNERYSCEFEVTEDMLVDGEYNCVGVLNTGEIEFRHSSDQPEWGPLYVKSGWFFGSDCNDVALGAVVAPIEANNNLWCITKPGRYLVVKLAWPAREYSLLRMETDGFSPVASVFTKHGSIWVAPKLYHAPKKVKTVNISIEVDNDADHVIVNGQRVEV